MDAPSTIRSANACTVWGLHPLWLNHKLKLPQASGHMQLVQVNGTCVLGQEQQPKLLPMAPLNIVVCNAAPLNSFYVKTTNIAASHPIEP